MGGNVSRACDGAGGSCDVCGVEDAFIAVVGGGLVGVGPRLAGQASGCLWFGALEAFGGTGLCGIVWLNLTAGAI